MSIFKKKSVIYPEVHLNLAEFEKLLRKDNNISEIFYTRMIIDGKPVFQKGNILYYIDCTFSKIKAFLNSFSITDNSKIKITSKIGSGITCQNLLFLLKKKNVKIDNHLETLTVYEEEKVKGILDVTVEEINDLKRELNKLDAYLKSQKVKNDYELVKIIHDYYLRQSHYWDPLNYYNTISYTTKLECDRNTTCRHPDNYVGLIGSNHYATCAGLSDGLVGIFNFCGLDASIIKDELHAIVKLKLADGRVTYIDLARELSERFEDSLYNGCRKKEPTEYPKKNRNYFLVSKAKFIGKNNMTDFEKSISCNLEEEINGQDSTGAKPKENRVKKQEYNEEYIPGTKIPKPRVQGVNETTKEYEKYLEYYYGKYFSTATNPKYDFTKPTNPKYDFTKKDKPKNRK